MKSMHKAFVGLLIAGLILLNGILIVALETTLDNLKSTEKLLADVIAKTTEQLDADLDALQRANAALKTCAKEQPI